MNNYLLGSWVFVYLGVYKLRRSCSIACIVVLGALICLVRFTQYLLYFFLFRSSTLCHDNMRTNGSNIVFVFFFFLLTLCSAPLELSLIVRQERIEHTCRATFCRHPTNISMNQILLIPLFSFVRNDGEEERSAAAQIKNEDKSFCSGHNECVLNNKYRVLFERVSLRCYYG